jgi:excinuclease ABC subunit B
MATYKLKTLYPPAGDQPKAIEQLVEGRPGRSTLLGVTGSGKTYTIANVIAQQQKPVLILSPNKTLAAQLYEEFSLFFPENKVCYFVSYYDYYQPESYLPAQDIYIAKETKVNSEIERLRIEATASIINRPDTIIVASVSCIYSLGNPSDYRTLALSLHKGQTLSRSDLIRELIFIQYVRNDFEKRSGTFQARGSSIEVILPYQRERLRIELEGSTVVSLAWIHKHSGELVTELDTALIFPARHFVTTQEKKEAAIASIEAELEDWLPRLKNPLYQERLKARVTHDIELLRERGICPGIENYSAHFDKRTAGETPSCLFDFFSDFLLVIDESHIAIPQLQGMYMGDRARKQSLIDFGFRLPSARDNRPLKFAEIERHFKDVIYVSATPGSYELTTTNHIVEQVVRPTGLLDPALEVHPRSGQLEHMIEQIKITKNNGYRSLVTVLTKKLAEDLAIYLEERGVKVCYLHCDIKTPQRTELLHKLREGIFDCLVGVNLLREGIDLPEVALVAIMDADVESFLRDKRSLIQIIGRAARNSESRVILYADRITTSLHAAIDETRRRRSLQQLHNEVHGIVPKTVKRKVTQSISNIQKAIAEASKAKKKKNEKQSEGPARIIELEKLMHDAAQAGDFETAITYREEYLALKKLF